MTAQNSARKEGFTGTPVLKNDRFLADAVLNTRHLYKWISNMGNGLIVFVLGIVFFDNVRWEKQCSSKAFFMCKWLGRIAIKDRKIRIAITFLDRDRDLRSILKIRIGIGILYKGSQHFLRSFNLHFYDIKRSILKLLYVLNRRVLLATGDFEFFPLILCFSF